MDNPTNICSAGKPPEVISPSRSLRRRNSSASNSPEFEFWRLTNPSSQPDPDLVSADELFLDGVLLPLQLLSLKPAHSPNSDGSIPDPDPPPSDPSAPLVHELDPATKTEPTPEPGHGPGLFRETVVSGFTSSKRWRDMFRKSESKPPAKSREHKEKESKKRERKSQTVSGSSAGAELNINIWPFSRSRSTGNIVTRPRMSFGAPVTRKVSSAPCSRSNSAGESKSRKWPSSPGPVGVHLGRNSPVWQVRRGVIAGKPVSESPVDGSSGERGGGGKREITEGRRGKRVNENHKAKVLNLNVPMCIGYRNRLSCRSDESGSSNNRSGNSRIGSGSSNNPNAATTMFGLRNLFIKKVH
ncbi:PREDICTED: serine/arginine repetitive matrix protein 3-like [Tarenaya hassleriana]|uniref:serine/arginine repetitive matrix protein 3-like n=1 Tax=Tarenaya hassleriana TaxID=28532 RepID=UPI00053C6102|nr:PREDICTED: serine/arginine repetitive matrix protein 3-like [Tarenaya hassleriana]